ncbi:MAG: hypothetical protein ABWY23_04730 [Mycetocola sp.]
MRTALLGSAATLAVVALLTGCTTAGEAKPDPVTLTMYHIDGDLALDPAADWFIEAVSELSKGRITVDVTSECCGDVIDMEEQLVASVADGGADLGWVGTRVFGDLGVTALEPLTAPFMVDSYELQAAVITSPPADAALAALETLGVVPIALEPGMLRRPLSATKPLHAPADWAGLTIGSFHSSQNAESFIALGAEPVDVTFEQRNDGVFDGSIQALENSVLMLRSDRARLLPYVTANVVLWPRTSAIIGNEAALDLLGTSGRAILDEAAALVAQRTDDLIEIDADAVEKACEQGARFSDATAGQLAELEAAFAGIHNGLRNDAATGDLYAAVVALKSSVPAEPRLEVAANCTGQPPERDSAVSGGDVAVLNGSYRSAAYTVEFLTANGFTADEAEGVAGTFTFIFDDGAFELVHDWHGGETFGCVGTYSVGADRLTVNYDPNGDCGPGGELFNANFSVTQTQLVLQDIDSPHEADAFLFTSQPFTRVQ